MLSYSERKTFAAHGDRSIQATIDTANKAIEADRAAQMEANRAKFAARNTRVPFTEEQYKAAQHVRTELGWHKVVRVNAKSVSVETGYSWTDRIVRDKIIEVR